MIYCSETHSGLSQTSKMGLFAKIINFNFNSRDWYSSEAVQELPKRELLLKGLANVFMFIFGQQIASNISLPSVSCLIKSSIK